MSRVTTSTKWTININRHVSKFCAQAMKSLKQAVIADYAPANASADRKVNKIVMSLTCAKLPLSQPSHVRIVVEMDRHSKMFRKFGGKRKILPLSNIGSGENCTSIRIKRTWRGNTNGNDILLPNGFDGVLKPVKDPRLAGKCLCPLIRKRFGSIGLIGSDTDMLA